MKSTDGSIQVTWRIRAIVTAISLVAVIFLFPESVQAGKILRVSAIPAGQVIENDVFLTGQQPVVNGTVNGDVFIVGSDVTISGEVNGSVFVVAENLNLPGRVRGNMYAAVVELTQPAGGSVERNLYALALSLITEDESLIGRNLNAMAMSANLQGATSRETNAIIGPWELFKLLRDAINRNITGSVTTQANPVEGTTVQIAYHPVSAPQISASGSNAAAAPGWSAWLLNALLSLAKFLIVGGVMLWIFPQHFDGWVKQLQNKPLASAGYGAVVLINGYLIPVLILTLLSGLLLGLIYLSLPALAWTLFAAGLGFLTAFFSLFLAATAFLSKAIVAYLAGVFILSRTAPGSLRYRIIPLFLGLLIYVPLASVPYVGFFIGLVATLLGLGSIWLARKPALLPEEAAIESVPA